MATDSLILNLILNSIINLFLNLILNSQNEMSIVRILIWCYVVRFRRGDIVRVRRGEIVRVRTRRHDELVLHPLDLNLPKHCTDVQRFK